MSTDVPPRVLAAEARREFRRLLERSSLGCPLSTCEHLVGDHDADGWTSRGTPINPRCRRCGCGDEPPT